MPLFEETTPVETSPGEGHVEETAVENEETGIVEEETEEVEESPEEGHDDSLLAGKYRTVEDLTKAYKSLERSFHESRQKQPPKETPVDGEDPNEIVQRAFEQDPLGTIQYFVNQALAPMTEKSESETLTRNFENVTKTYGKQLSTDEGMKSYFEKIGEIATELGNPALAKNPSNRVLKMAAEELWGTESKQQTYDKAKAKGREEAEIARQSKLGLSAPKGAKPKETPKTEAERIREGIMSVGNSGLFG